MTEAAKEMLRCEDEHLMIVERAQLRVRLGETGWWFVDGAPSLAESAVSRCHRLLKGDRWERSVRVEVGLDGEVKLRRYVDGDRVRETIWTGHLPIDEIITATDAALTWERPPGLPSSP